MPTYTTTTGYTLVYQILPPDFLPALRARVRAEMEADAPAVPTVRVARGPDAWDDVPVQVDGELPEDNPGLRERILAYRAARAAWEQAVLHRLTDETQRILTRLIKVEPDPPQIALIRELYALAGKPLDDLSDHAIMVWYVALPDAADQAAMTQALQGISVGEAASAARALFRRELGWEAA